MNPGMSSLKLLNPWLIAFIPAGYFPARAIKRWRIRPRSVIPAQCLPSRRWGREPNLYRNVIL